MTLTEDTTALDYPGWNLFAHIAVIVGAERRFGITFAATEVGALQRVGDLAHLIEGRSGGLADPVVLFNSDIFVLAFLPIAVAGFFWLSRVSQQAGLA